MNSVLFCIPLKNDHLKQFRNFVQQTSDQKSDEWRSMLARYDISSVKIWVNHIDGIDYAYVYHDIGPDFNEKIKTWNDSRHPFDQWFDQQIKAVYDSNATENNATLLLELIV